MFRKFAGFSQDSENHTSPSEQKQEDSRAILPNKTGITMTTSLTTFLLSETQIATLCAAVDRIIPADDAPSGWEAGVGEYFAHLLTRERQFLFPTRQGLDALDGEAQATEGKAFAALPPDTQDALLARIEAGEVRTDWPQPAPAFFHRLVSQVMEGYYADPGNGGNKDGAAWKMIGFRVTG